MVESKKIELTNTKVQKVCVQMCYNKTPPESVCAKVLQQNSTRKCVCKCVTTKLPQQVYVQMCYNKTPPESVCAKSVTTKFPQKVCVRMCYNKTNPESVCAN